MMPHDLTALEALGVAIRAESEAAEVYRDLARGVGKPFFQRKVLLLAREELQHKRILDQIRDPVGTFYRFTCRAGGNDPFGGRRLCGSAAWNLLSPLRNGREGNLAHGQPDCRDYEQSCANRDIDPKSRPGPDPWGAVITDGLLNRIEMAFRAYDPCFACATHSLPGEMPLEVRIYDVHGNLVASRKR